MKLNKIVSAVRAQNSLNKKLYASSLAALMMATPAIAADETDGAAAEQDIEVIQVSGIRGSLASALNAKRESNNLVEVIDAEDIGKLPDQNLAEVLENITGIQITRTAGVGTGVQIRGTNANRVEINGVSTVGAGSGRNGISFEDVNAAIIAGVEVTKSPQAKTVEGSVGGTVNLRTIRPLELSETLANVRVQAEQSSLSTEGATPRLSGSFGDNWDTDMGEVGFVISASYTEQEAVSFRPRADRDNLANIDGQPEFMGIQFLVQEQENDDYETINLATTFEWAPNENTKFYFDAILNDQERSRDQYRLQASGVSTLRDISIPSQFETINFGTLGGVDLGSKQAALVGVLDPDLANDDDDPNLRFSSETAARVTDNKVFVLGGEWQGDSLKVSAQVSSSTASTVSPNLSTTLNFINPKCPLDGSSNDNCVPFEYDLSGGSLAFGIAQNSQYTPSASDLTNPNNVVLDAVSYGRNTTDNSETGFRVDFEYYLDAVDFITTIDFGMRHNISSSEYEDIDDSFGFSAMEDSPNGSLFSDILVKGPSNYGDADGRDLFIADFLLIDPDLSFSNPDKVLSTLEGALAAHRELNPQADGALGIELESDQNAYYKVEEATTALYAQANFEYEMVRGNFGVRYVSTEVDSTAYGPEGANGSRSLETTSGDYSFVLPRLNVVADLTDDVVVRMGWGKDIRRPSFSSLNTGFTFDTSENAAVSLGNPGLEPEEVTSFDLSAEWYFAEAAVVSVGYFTKDRTNIFGQDFEGALLIEDSSSTSGFVRETDPSCPGGGIYNPDVIPGVLGDPNTLGMCVDFTKPGNDPETTTQSGIEMAFQYDLSSFESELGWASGFGLVANYTIQEFEGGSVSDTTSGRGLTVLGDVTAERGLLDFSENAYNFTLYYEKYGLSARMRYTWREAFRTQDFGGGANTSGSSTLSFPVVTGDRGQLNASVSYDVTDKLNIGIEAVNLTEERIDQYCVNDKALLCFVGLPDRRVTIGASYKF